MNFLKTSLFATILVSAISCQSDGPKDFILGKDQCDNCKMTITDLKYGTEMITEKGRVYKFDDISCMTMYESSEPDKAKNAKFYVIDVPSEKFVEKSNATLITGGEIKSPMGGNTQAFERIDDAEKAAAKLGATVTK